TKAASVRHLRGAFRDVWNRKRGLFEVALREREQQRRSGPCEGAAEAPHGERQESRVTDDEGARVRRWVIRWAEHCLRLVTVDVTTRVPQHALDRGAG